MAPEIMRRLRDSNGVHDFVPAARRGGGWHAGCMRNRWEMSHLGLCVRICCDNRSPFTGSPFTLDTRPFTVPVHTPSVHAVHTDQKRSVISVHSFRSPPVHGSPPFTVTPVHGDIRSRARRSQVAPVHEISVHRRSPFTAVHGIPVHRSPPFTGSLFAAANLTAKHHCP